MSYWVVQVAKGWSEGNRSYNTQDEATKAARTLRQQWIDAGVKPENAPHFKVDYFGAKCFDTRDAD